MNNKMSQLLHGENTSSDSEECINYNDIKLFDTNNEIEIFNLMKNKEYMNNTELSVYMFFIIKHLIRIENNRVANIENYFDSVKNMKDICSKSENDLRLLYTEHEEIINTYNKSNKFLIQDRVNLTNDINMIMKRVNSNESIKNLLSSLSNNSDEDMIACQYKDICIVCKDTSIHNTSHGKYDHCFHCDYCNSLRDYREKYEKKRLNDMLKIKLDEKYNKTVSKSKNKPESNKIKLKNDPININNTYIQININQNFLKSTFVDTKDRFFEVFIKNKNNNIDELKYIFINLMCRVNAINIFPYEENYNNSLTYPLEAGLYTINDNNELHGILRYKHTTSSRMTLNKLQNICNKKDNIIKVNQLKLVDDIKSHYCIDQLSSIINTITTTNSYGSNIENFYTPDKILTIDN
jgi:hypothetical protein